ncbi:MAG TPA: hypothetical protein VEO18_07900 [Thermoplasmata archaeon]|nr:hypothetical protein [Thermoplasmata archaeon]
MEGTRLTGETETDLVRCVAGRGAMRSKRDRVGLANLQVEFASYPLPRVGAAGAGESR